MLRCGPSSAGDGLPRFGVAQEGPLGTIFLVKDPRVFQSSGNCTYCVHIARMGLLWGKQITCLYNKKKYTTLPQKKMCNYDFFQWSNFLIIAQFYREKKTYTKLRFLYTRRFSRSFTCSHSQDCPIWRVLCITSDVASCNTGPEGSGSDSVVTLRKMFSQKFLTRFLENV